MKYTTGHSGSDNKEDQDDLEDIAIVSNTDLGEVTYGGGAAPNYSQANGPRLVPGKLFIGYYLLNPESRILITWP